MFEFVQLEEKRLEEKRNTSVTTYNMEKPAEELVAAFSHGPALIRVGASRSTQVPRRRPTRLCPNARRR